MSEPLPKMDQARPPAFGQRIRDLRRKADLTLQALADQAGVSVGFLSQVERDKATPSLGTLAGIASALGVEVDYFVATPKAVDSVTREGERPRFALAPSSLSYEEVSTVLPGGTMSSRIIHIPEGYVSEVVAHEGEELIFVLDGVVRQVIDDNTFILRTGDSMHFMGQTPHSFANVGDGPARLLWTGTSPRLLGQKLGLKSNDPNNRRET
ncbi:MAG: helix-turn-helix domain-containing protein [Paracoccaceae bacterium]